MEISGIWGLPIPMVPCLYQDNDYIKNKPRVWTAQKYNFLVGAKTVPAGTGLHSLPSHSAPYRVHNGPLRNLGSAYRKGTVFAPRQ